MDELVGRLMKFITAIEERLADSSAAIDQPGEGTTEEKTPAEQRGKRGAARKGSRLLP